MTLNIQHRFFNDVELKDSNKYKIQSKQNTFSLTIYKCNRSDDGIYRVHINNDNDNIEQTTKLNVKGN